MTRLQRWGLGLYFRRFAFLVAATRFLAERAIECRRYRGLLSIVDRALLRPFYRASTLAEEDAVRRLTRAHAILRAHCICAPATERHGSCFYLDDAAEAYLRHGPRPDGFVSADAARADIVRRNREAGTWLMTVVGDSPCVMFPREYVVCCCQRERCLVTSLQATFPRLSIVDPPRSSERPSWRVLGDHVVAFLVGVPALASWIAAYLTNRRGVSWRSWGQLLLLLLLAAVGGGIIADPSMWRFLHWPTWRYNADFTVLLPIAAAAELAGLTGGIELFRRWTGSPGSIAETWRRVLPALLAFQLVHVLRFASVRALLEALPPADSRALFWAWDPVAYLALLVGLMRYRPPRSVPPAHEHEPARHDESPPPPTSDSPPTLPSIRSRPKTGNEWAIGHAVRGADSGARLQEEREDHEEDES